MTVRILIECGVAETRAALINDNGVWKFWFGPARGDEAEDGAIISGRRFAGRITAIDKSLKAAFVDIGDSKAAFLPLKATNEVHLTDGALIEIEVTAPPRQNKGAVVRFVSADVTIQQAGRLPPVPDPALEAVEAFGRAADEIIIDDGGARSLLDGAGFPNVAHDAAGNLFEKSGASEALASAFGRNVLLDGGGRIVIDEAQALTAIDVDTSDLAAASSARLREKVALAAAREAVRQISLRNIGGHVVIDFPNLSGNTQRQRFTEFLKTQLARLDGVKAQSFSKSGLFSFTLPRRTWSLLDRFSEQENTTPVPGRKFTLEAKAKAAMRALEHRLRAQPSARLRLAMGARLGEYMDGKNAWRDRLHEKYGARTDYLVVKKLEECSFDLSEQ